MADENPTVEEATKQLGAAVLEYALATAELPLKEREPFAAAVGVARDALIAAVRAEMQEAIDTKDRAHAMAIDREFALADELERVKLTDADVDAFLAAVDETDPERVERIRKLFDQKFKLGQGWVTKVTNEPND